MARCLTAFFFAAAFVLPSLSANEPDSWSRERKKPAETKNNAKGQGGDSAAGESGSTRSLVKPLDEVWRIVFRNAKGEDVVLDCEVARSEKDKERGLMFRKTLAKNRGMIFVYTKAEEMNFWMQNTYVPLSNAYIHERLFVSSIHDMKPMSLDIVSSETAVLYAIEANQGWFKANGILPGNRITIYKNPDEYKIERKNKYRKEIPSP